VDDEPAIGVALRRNLGDHEVSFTTNGLEALARLTQGERFDVILCDLTMPGIGGDELYGMVMAVAPEQAKRIVFISGGATTARAQAFIDTVPNLVLRKPFDTSKLRQLIRARLGARRM
jgi:CheY-like chemotaxis protein